MLGDFYQLPPVVPADTLYSTVLAHHVFNTLRGHENQPLVDGAILFSKFELIQLNIQERAAQDPEHCALIQKLRDPSRLYPLTSEIVESFYSKIITPEDYRQDPSWGEATLVVTSHAEKEVLNYEQARRFAVKNGKVILRWRLKISGPHFEFMSEQEVEQLYQQEKGLWGYFVQDAPSFIDENIDPSKKVANGTFVTMHSVTLDARDNSGALAQRIQSSPAGTVIDLEREPLTINVKVPHSNPEKPTKWVEGEYLEIDSTTGVPVIAVGLRTTLEDVEIGPVGRLRASKVKTKRHRVELGFVVTFQKMQGLTVSKLILDLNERPFQPRITLQGLYVGETRVKKGVDIRILPLQANKTLDYLKDLQRNRHLAAWLEGFGADGKWDPEKSREALTRIEESDKEETRKKNPKKKC